MPPPFSSSARSKYRSFFTRYLVAVLSFGAGLLMRFVLSSALGFTIPYITFFPAIMLSAWYGGLVPGLVTTALSAAAALRFVILPSWAGTLEKPDLVGMMLFLATGSAISWLNEVVTRQHRQVESELRAREESDAALRASEQRYRIMADAASDGIVTIDEKSTILSANPAAARMFGYTLQEILGHPLTMLMPEHLRPVHEASLRRYVETRERHLNWQGVQLPGLHKNGTQIDVEVAFGEYTRDGHLVFTGVIRDIGERKRFDEQLQHTARLESLGVLAGGVAHDFNNLLTGILGNASLACDILPPENPARPLIRNVVEASERAGHLTRQLLAYAGKGRFVVEPLNLSALAREICNLLRSSIPKNVQVRLDLQETLPSIVGDASQLQQVLMNLIINGAEAIPAGEEGTVLMKTGVQDVDEAYIRNVVLPENLERGQYVLLEVHDTGSGMDAATLDRIFDPFFTTKFTGRGLGLAAVLGIVRGHKGALKVYSMPGRGTTFKILFPISEERRAVRPAAAGAENRRSMSGCVLVVDDEEIVGKVAKAALEQHGFQVQVAASGAEAIEVFQSGAWPVRIVVLDLTMPGLSGEETLRRLQSIDPDVSVILSSGYNEIEVIQRFAGKGLAGFIQKPYSASALVDKVAGILAAGGSEG